MQGTMQVEKKGVGTGTWVKCLHMVKTGGCSGLEVRVVMSVFTYKANVAFFLNKDDMKE